MTHTVTISIGRNYGPDAIAEFSGETTLLGCRANEPMADDVWDAFRRIIRERLYAILGTPTHADEFVSNGVWKNVVEDNAFMHAGYEHPITDTDKREIHDMLASVKRGFFQDAIGLAFGTGELV